jgi:hypothetical protein
MSRPNERELLADVLRDLADIPEGLAERIMGLLDEPEANRASALRELFEEFTSE